MSESCPITTRLVPLFFKAQGDILRCPDCFAQGVRLPIVDEEATALMLPEGLMHTDLPAARCPHRLLAGGLILRCTLCGHTHRADLDRAEDPAVWVWRISRVEAEDDAP